MGLLLTLALFFATPTPKGAPPADTDPFAHLPSAAAVTFTDYLETRRKLGQTLEVLETKTENSTTRAVLLERTGCLRGWIVLSATAARSKSEAPSFEAIELFDRDCKAPGPMMHFARLQDALRRRDAATATRYLGTDLHFPLAIEGQKMTRRTLTGDAVVTALKDPKAKPPLPLCDLTRELASCVARNAPDASGSTPWTCECSSSKRRVIYEMRQLEPTLGAPDSPIQVVSVKERLTR